MKPQLSEAQQGHAYDHAGVRVLALESGPTVNVRPIVPDTPWLGEAYRVEACDLQPLPMAYFHGSVPQ